MSKGNLMFGSCFLLAGWMNLAIGANDGLILGFKAAQEVRLVSLVAAQLSARRQVVAGPHWKLRATDSSGRETWVRSFVVPRQFDEVGAQEFSFSVVVPRLDSGTQLSMQEVNGVEIWRGSVDDAMLKMADRKGELIGEELARSATKSVSRSVSSTASNALRTRQGKPYVGPLNSPDADGIAQVAARASESLPEYRGPSDSVLRGNPVPASSENQPNLRKPSSDRSVEIANEGLESKSPIPAKMTAEDSWQIEVTLLDTSGHMISAVPTGYAYSYDDPENRQFPFDASLGRLRVQVPKGADFGYRLFLSNMPGYTPTIFLRVGAISGNTSLSFTLKPAAQARIRINVENGSSLPDGTRVVQCDSAGEDPEVRYFHVLGMGGNIEAALPMPYDESLKCIVFIDESRLQVTFNDVVFRSSTPQVLTLPETGGVTIRLLEAGGNYFSGSFSVAWFGINANSFCVANPCHLLLPTRAPVELNVIFNDGSYRNFSIGPEVFAPGTIRTVTLKREYEVSGTVGIVGLPYDYTRVRALDSTNGGLILSTVAEWPTGHFELPLVEGTYVFEAEQNMELLSEGSAFYRSPWRSDPIHVSSDAELPPLSSEDNLGQLVLTAQVPCHGSGSYRSDTPARVVVSAANGTRIERVVIADSATTNEPCTSRYLARLSPGIYDVEFSPIGWPARSIGNVQVATGVTAVRNESFSADTRTYVWSGVLRTASGEAVAGAFIRFIADEWESQS